MFREIESSITPHQESPPFIRMLRSVAGRIRLELEVNFLDLSRSVAFATDPV